MQRGEDVVKEVCGLGAHGVDVGLRLFAQIRCALDPVGIFTELIVTQPERDAVIAAVHLVEVAEIGDHERRRQIRPCFSLKH